MRVDKASRAVKVLSTALGGFSCLSPPSSSFCLGLEHEVGLTMTFSKNPNGKNSSSVIERRGTYSSRSMGWISCLLMFLDSFFPLEWWGIFFLPCLFLRRRNGGWTWFCFFSLHRVIRVQFSSSLLGTSERMSASIKGPWDGVELKQAPNFQIKL